MEIEETCEDTKFKLLLTEQQRLISELKKKERLDDIYSLMFIIPIWILVSALCFKLTLCMILGHW